MKNVVQIDAETADRIVVCSLRESIDCLKESIEKLKRKKKLKDYEKEDLVHSIRSLDALEEVYDYFGGNVK